MSEAEKAKPYVYQPFGIQDKEHWAAERIYAVICESRLTIISGLTKPEAAAVLAALNQLDIPP